MNRQTMKRFGWCKATRCDMENISNTPLGSFDDAKNLEHHVYNTPSPWKRLCKYKSHYISQITNMLFNITTCKNNITIYILENAKMIILIKCLIVFIQYSCRSSCQHSVCISSQVLSTQLFHYSIRNSCQLFHHDIMSPLCSQFVSLFRCRVLETFPAKQTSS